MPERIISVNARGLPAAGLVGPCPAENVNPPLTITRDRSRVWTRSSLISFFCFECDRRTSTPYDWLVEHGVTCEQCYEKIPVDVEELGRGLAAIDLAWGEVDTVVQELNRPLPPIPNWAMPERVPPLVSTLAEAA